jgi:hypothetical protein
MNDNGTINLKNLRKSPPAGEQPLPMSMPASVRASAPAAMMTPPSPPTAAPAASMPSARPAMAGLPKSGRTTDWHWWAKRGGIAAIAFLILFGIGYYIYANIWTKSPFGPTPGVAAESTQAESEVSQAAASAASTSALTVGDIVARVGKIMLLPENETPTLAGVSDPSVLGDQAFFKNAKTGDVVLMYATSRRAILYDPVANKIIEVAPITDATSTQP